MDLEWKFGDAVAKNVAKRKTKSFGEKEVKMIKGKRVYDPLTNTWSTGYWIPVYCGTMGNAADKTYMPVW